MRSTAENLTYNPWGRDLNGPGDWDAPVPPVIAGNSNSVNCTLVEAMGLRLPSMPYMAPGIENPLLCASRKSSKSQEQRPADPQRQSLLISRRTGN